MRKIKLTTLTKEEQKQELLQMVNYNIDKIMDLLIEYIELDNKRADEVREKTEPISVTKDEFAKIMGMFKIKGVLQSSYLNNYIEFINNLQIEGRGRPMGVKNKNKEEVYMDLYNQLSDVMVSETK